MNKEYTYTSIKEVLSRVLRHPLLQEVTLEQAVQYTVDFIGIFGMPKLYFPKQETVHIEDFKGLLPCDLISINQVKDCRTHVCLRAMTDSFNPRERKSLLLKTIDQAELSFKTQGRVIVTSFKEGDIEVAYLAIPVDEDGFPLIIDNAIFLNALELYIKKKAFTILFDMGKIQAPVLQNTQQEYAWAAGQLSSEFTIPSLSELEALKNSWCTLLQRSNQFEKAFKEDGSLERVRVQ